MKLLYAVHGYKPAFRIGGPAVSVPAVAERLVRRGHDVTVFTSNLDLGEELDVPLEKEVDVNGVRVWYFSTAKLLSRWLPGRAGRAGGFLYAPGMARVLRQQVAEMDAVHTHLPFIYPTYAAANAAFAARKPLFCHQRGVFDPQRLAFHSARKKIYLELIEKPLLNRATMLIALTAHEETTFRELGIRAPCRVIPNGVELPSRETDVEGRAREKWGFADDEKIILFLGRIHPLKGCELLVHAFVLARKLGVDARLVMAGPDEQGETNRLRQLVHRMGVADSVQFVGAVAAQDKALLLARADLFCLPSIGEGFSMAVLEALASGIPVLISSGCNFPEVEQVGAGFVIRNEPQEWASAMRKLLGDDDRLARMGKAGVTLAQEKYSWDRIVDSIEDAYREGIVASRRGSNG